MKHINRFVREISHFVIVAVFTTSKDVLIADQSIEGTFRILCDQFVPIVIAGLGDNWS